MAKDINLTFRVTPEFDNMVRADCSRLGMEMSEYVRSAIMLGRPLLSEYQVLKLIRLEDTILKK